MFDCKKHIILYSPALENNNNIIYKMGDVTVSIVGQNVVINNMPYPLNTVFKMGQQQGITFDEHFWRKVYCGDVNKDGCPMDILKKTVRDWDISDKISAAEVKKMSSDMTNSLIDNQLIFKAEILRLKKYKTEFPEELKTQFDSAFQENPRVYVNKDCGLNPAIFMIKGKCFKSCNVASDEIDPHSAKTEDCNTTFPNTGHTLILEPSVFEYLQYPRPCILIATTRGGGKYALDFRIKDINGNETQITPDYFAGNATKKASLKKTEDQSIIENNAKLCVAKYSGDTLQSLIQRIFQIYQKEGLNEFVVSTCDSIVALRSFALNGSYIEITDDETKEKVTQVFIWRPNLADPVALERIFSAEKNKFVKEYADFYDLVKGIKIQQARPDHNFNNIYVSGSETTYKFKEEFYDRVLIDIIKIASTIYKAKFNPNDRDGGISIRTLRTFKINDFLKTNGPRGEYYCITMAAKYTKGDLSRIGLDNIDVNNIGKRPSQSFFEVATSIYNASLRRGGKIRGGTDPANIMRPPDQMDLDSMLNYYFDMDFYKRNPIVKTMFKNGDYDDNAERSNMNIDLHAQFIQNFKTEFLKQVSPSNVNYKLLFFDCFSDVINSFGILDLEKPKLRYYSEDAIRYLIEQYLIILKSRITKELEHKTIIQLKKNRAKSNNARINRSRRGNRSRSNSSRHPNKTYMQQIVEKSKSHARDVRQTEIERRFKPGGSKPSGSKTRKIRR